MSGASNTITDIGSSMQVLVTVLYSPTRGAEDRTITSTSALIRQPQPRLYKSG